MKEIKLTQGQVALVDAADFNWLNQWKWFAHKERRGFYAWRWANLQDGRRVILRMHRIVLGLEYGDTRQGDHVNHNTLDNRRENLRIVTSQQNAFNQGDAKGYSYVSRLRKFRAYITLNGKQIYLGLFVDNKDAALAYSTAKEKYHNIPPQRAKDIANLIREGM